MRGARLLGILLGAALGCAAFPVAPAAAATLRYDVVVYGATPSGVLAAVTAARAGVSVALLEPSAHVGGMLSNGLQATDIGDKATVGGYSREFFDRIQALYRAYGVETRWRFQAHSAESVFGAMLRTTSVKLYLRTALAESGGVTKSGATIASVRTTDGRIFAAGVFIDASYEGDLMADSGVAYAVGRESAAQYGESLGGVRVPLVVARITGSLPPGIVNAAPGQPGTADRRVQAANYRICLSVNPDSRIPLTRPADYDPARYSLTLAYILGKQAATGETARLSWVVSTYPIVRGQYDANDVGAASLSLPGSSWEWPDGTYAERAAIEAWHASFDRGLLWFLASDPAVPASVRTEMSKFGLCSTEWTDNGYWPRRLYIREGRRMIGRYLLTQRDLDPARTKASVIAIGSYRIDSHYVSRWLVNGTVYAEGLASGSYQPYMIPYRSITPNAAQATNLLVPVCLSATHVAWSSVRMEPHLMMTGEAAGQAAAMAVRGRRTVQAIDEVALKAALRAHGAVLAYP